MQHDRHHRRLDAVEHPRHHGQVAKGDIDPGQQHQHQQRGQDEQPASDEAAPGTVQQPADVGRQLLRFRAGQQHAVVERVQEPALADPAAPLDELGMHDRDLPGGSAEADAPSFSQKRSAAAKVGAGGRSAGRRAVTAAVRTKFRDAAA
jgi:hypothetical protein